MTYNSNKLTVNGEERNYGYDIDAVIDYIRMNSKCIDVEFPNGRVLEFSSCGFLKDPYHELFGMCENVWKANKRACAKEISLKDLVPDSAPAESVYEALNKACVEGKNICVVWGRKTLYSVDASSFEKEVRIRDIEEKTPEDYRKSHPEVDISKAHYVSSIGLTFDEIVKEMLKANKNGENIYTRFEGSERIYSVWAKSVDSIYLQAYDETKEQREDKLLMEQRNRSAREYEAKQKKDYMLELCAIKFEAHPERKQNAYEGRHFSDFNEMAEKLVELANIGRNVHIKWQDNDFYTCEITCMDDIYQKQWGKTYKEFTEEQEQKRREWLYNREEEELQFKAILPQKTQELYEKALPFLSSSELADELREWVDIRCQDIYHGRDMENAIDIMEALSKGDIQSAAKLFDDENHSGWSGHMVYEIVYKFRPDDFEDFKNAVENEIERDEIQRD